MQLFFIVTILRPVDIISHQAYLINFFLLLIINNKNMSLYIYLLLLFCRCLSEKVFY